jgi:hypothetical protein
MFISSNDLSSLATFQCAVRVALDVLKDEPTENDCAISEEEAFYIALLPRIKKIEQAILLESPAVLTPPDFSLLQNIVVEYRKVFAPEIPFHQDARKNAQGAFCHEELESSLQCLSQIQHAIAVTKKILSEDAPALKAYTGIENLAEKVLQTLNGNFPWTDETDAFFHNIVLRYKQKYFHEKQSESSSFSRSFEPDKWIGQAQSSSSPQSPLPEEAEEDISQDHRPFKRRRTEIDEPQAPVDDPMSDADNLQGSKETEFDTRHMFVRFLPSPENKASV